MVTPFDEKKPPVKPKRKTKKKKVKTQELAGAKVNPNLAPYPPDHFPEIPLVPEPGGGMVKTSPLMAEDIEEIQKEYDLASEYDKAVQRLILTGHLDSTYAAKQTDNNEPFSNYEKQVQRLVEVNAKADATPNWLDRMCWWLIFKAASVASFFMKDK